MASIKISGLALSQVIEKYTNNPKLIYLSLPTKQMEFTLTQSHGWSNRIAMCPFCSVFIEKFNHAEKRSVSDVFIKAIDAMNISYGSLVVQEMLGEPQYVQWLHGQTYPIVPKRIWMLSFRDGRAYPISQSQCKEFHERDAQTLLTVPSEPLLEHTDAVMVFEFIKIHMPEILMA